MSAKAAVSSRKGEKLKIKGTFIRPSAIFFLFRAVKTGLVP